MQPTFTLSPTQRAEFDRRGILALPQFFAADDIARMRDALWADLEKRFGMRRAHPETWSVVRPAHFQKLGRSGAFDCLASPAFLSLVDTLMGKDTWTVPRHWGLPLVTMPSREPDLARVMWHFDVPGADYRNQLPAVRAFAFLEPAVADGGGTLVVTGSHLVGMALLGDGEVLASAKLRVRLKSEHPWFAELYEHASAPEIRARINDRETIAGVDVEIVQMTGEPGDLILMHPLLLHGVAHNATDRPRMMVTLSAWRK